MAENEKNHDHSGFWFGLVIGAVAAGLLVLFLDRENKENLRQNLEKEWQSLLTKIKGLMAEKEEEPSLKESAPPVKSERAVTTKRRKFFLKNGKRLSRVIN